MGKTNIEWTDFTFNGWRGCSKVSDGCKNCYAETLSKRNPGTLGVWGVNGHRSIAAESYWKQPIKWNRDAEAARTSRRVFCASLADVFEGNDTMPEASHQPVREARRRLFKLIQATPHLDWLLLTKRPENIRRLTYQAIDPDHPDNDYNACGDPNGLDAAPFRELYPNLWLGVSVEDQKTADERIPHLLKLDAAVRFLSMEPLLGPVDLANMYPDGFNFQMNALTGEGKHLLGFTGQIKPIDWVICGGESGPNARPMHPDWVRSIRDQCIAANVPFHFKQWGEWLPFRQITTEQSIDKPRNWPNLTHTNHYFDEGSTAYKLGKKAAGRILDGRTWDQYPTRKGE